MDEGGDITAKLAADLSQDEEFDGIVSDMRSLLAAGGERLCEPEDITSAEETWPWICLINLAGLSSRCLHDGEAVSGHRLWAVERVVLAGLWRQPWIGLVDQYFPGAGPTRGELEEFQARAKLEREAEKASLAALWQQIDRLVNLLEAHDFVVPDEVDLLVLARLLWVRTDVDGPASEGKDPKEFVSEIRGIVAKSMRPDHDAWDAVLRGLFPDLFPASLAPPNGRFAPRAARSMVRVLPVV